MTPDRPDFDDTLGVESELLSPAELLFDALLTDEEHNLLFQRYKRGQMFRFLSVLVGSSDGDPADHSGVSATGRRIALIKDAQRRYAETEQPEQRSLFVSEVNRLLQPQEIENILHFVTDPSGYLGTKPVNVTEATKISPAELGALFAKACLGLNNLEVGELFGISKPAIGEAYARIRDKMFPQEDFHNGQKAPFLAIMESVVPPRFVLPDIDTPGLFNRISTQEMHILLLMGEGYRPAEVADTLGLKAGQVVYFRKKVAQEVGLRGLKFDLIYARYEMTSDDGRRYGREHGRL